MNLIVTSLQTQVSPVVYLAGKIAPHGWRDHIVGHRAGSVPGNCGQGPDDADELFDPNLTLDCGTFRYGGPFFIHCDHGCFHGPSTHGVGREMEIDIGKDGHVLRRDELHHRVFRVNYERVRRADIVFAYINERDCYGTLIEIGHAQAFGKPLVVAFGPGADQAQMWMAGEDAIVLWGDIGEVWPLVERTIFRPKARRRAS